MDKHKQTPDILAEILGGEAPGMPAPILPDLRPETRQPPARPKRVSQPKPSAPTRPKAKPASKVEYRVVSFQDYKGWRPRFVNGKELKDWMEAPLLHEYLQQLSQEGWELAAASSGERLYGLGDKHQLYFRRPR